MGKIIRNGVIYTGSSDEADKIHYNNSNSDLAATTVQGAIDELDNDLATFTTHVNNRSNPHNVTAVQTGAMVAYNGYGENTFGTSDLNEWIVPGTYLVTSTAVNAPTTTDTWGTILIFGGFNDRIVQIFNRWNDTSNKMYYRRKNGSSWSEWVEFAAANKCLPLSGGTLTGADLYLYNGYGYVGSNDKYAMLTSMNTAKATATSRSLILANSNIYTLQNAVKLQNYINGSYVNYNLFGEHNVTIGNTDISAISLPEGCIYQQFG